MYLIKFAFLFILVNTIIMHVFWQQHYKTFQLFVTLVLKGEGGQKGN